MTAPHFRSAAAHGRNGNLIYQGIFAHSPCPYLVLTPDLVIVNANDAFLAIENIQRDNLVNNHLFDVFPEDPDDPTAEGQKKLSESFDRARTSQKPDSMVLRYDVCRNGVWHPCFWYPTNWPILDENGAIIAMVQHAIQIPTDAGDLVVQTRKLLDNSTTLIDTLNGAVERFSETSRLIFPDNLD